MAATANATVRATEQCWAHCVQRQFDLARDLMDDDFVHDDRRQALRNVITGRDGTIENNRVVAEMGFVPEFDPLVVHGQNLALARATFRDTSGNEVVSLQVLESNDEGLRVCCVSRRIAPAPVPIPTSPEPARRRSATTTATGLPLRYAGATVMLVLVIVTVVVALVGVSATSLAAGALLSAGAAAVFAMFVHQRVRRGAGRR